MAFFTSVSDQLPFYLSSGLCQGRLHIIDWCVSLLSQVSVLPPTVFRCQAHQHAFLHYCWWVVTSPSPWEWVADTGAVGYWISVQSGPVISRRLWSAHAAPQTSAGNSTLVSYWFLPLKVKIFPEGHWRFAHAAGQESDSYHQSH